ncbi:tetratricopeptide repeat protein [Rheinheimera sp.]|uniref:tetratricopeptide repeat protein n=1 Tax=Rheinheimera sp. TaxID=1869214 RepID=UPI002FDE3E83
MKFTLPLLLLVSLLQACSQTSAPPPAIAPQTPQHYFAKVDADAIPQVAAFYQLSEAQQQQFLQFYHQTKLQQLPGNKRLEMFLHQQLSNFHYEGKNYSASQTMQLMSGNCMSLAVLTTALAKLVNIEVGYRATYGEPMLNFSGDLFISSDHVRTYLFSQDEPDPDRLITQKAAVAIDYFPDRLDRLGAMFDHRRFAAMMYNNLAADALLADDQNKAFWLTQAALQQDPTYSASINLLGILYRRAGDLASAQQWYEFGLKHSINPAAIAGNYLQVAQELNDNAAIHRLEALLQQSNDDNPYNWFYLAYQAEQQQQQDKAILYYQKLLEQAPYLHRANLALARLYLQQNNNTAARTVLRQALRYSYEQGQVAMYKAKLQAVNERQSGQAQPE